MKSLRLSLLVFCLPLVLQARPAFISASIDLAGCHDDMVNVTVQVPAHDGDSIRYVIPRSVPGTYSRDDYGRFIMEAHAFAADGTETKVRRDDGDVILYGAPTRLEYRVRDTWDDPEAFKVFQPTGTNIQKDTNFVINTHGYFGFFEGFKNLPYEIQVRKPRGFYGATSLDRLELNDTVDILSAHSYPHLVDNPIMYCVPDTMSFMQNNMNVTIAIYSPRKKVTAAMVAHELQPLSAALGKFFGVMPVTRYTFILYFADPEMFSMSHRFSYGALEHSYSSFYFLPEGGGMSGVAESIRSTAGHEFLHILVPLNLHSEEVHDFDFRSPKMSQHLWLYEGCTEYFSVLSRAQDTLMSEREFFNHLIQKYRNGNGMLHGRTMSFTRFSRNVLTDENQALYPIVYETGAVLAFCLDMRIRELTGGRLDLLGVIRALSSRYGPERPFKDDDLVDEFVNLVGPDLRPFFDDFVIGEKAPPIQQALNSVGYSYKDSAMVKGFQFASSRIFFKPRVNDAVILSVKSENDFKIVDGDTLIKINDIQVTPDNKVEMLQMFIWQPKNDKEVSMLVHRNGQELTLKAAPTEKSIMRKNVVDVLENPAPNQVSFRKGLLKKS